MSDSDDSNLFQASPRPEMERLFWQVAGNNNAIGWLDLKRIFDEAFRNELPKVPSKNGGGLLTKFGKLLKDEVFGESKVGKNNNVEQVCTGFSKEVCRSMVVMLDVNQSGKLSFNEFQTLLANIDRWIGAFKQHDPDQSGRVNALKLSEAFRAAGYTLSSRSLEGLSNRYGSGDGSIGLDDFIMCAVKIKTMMGIFKEHDNEGTNRASFSMEEWVEKTLYL